MKTLCIDIDGVLAKEGEKNYFDYGNAQVVYGAQRAINNLYKLGYTIILHTARYEEDYDETKSWLNRKGFKYHKLIVGKPRADLYVDDRAVRFKNWDTALKEIEERA